MPDPTFPRLHIRPARGWVNDPNGLCLVDGRWHVFFQYRPSAPVHGDICWGHVSSTDLLRWTEHPVALRPRPGGIDSAGCWSGCVVDDGGVPSAVYTAFPGDPRRATVGLARGDRTLTDWTQDPLPAAAPPDLPGVSQSRDPFVFERAGRRYAVQGAGSAGGRPCLTLHDCTDLTSWRALGTVLTDADPWVARLAPAHVWECPNLLRSGDRWLLVLSLWRTGADGDVLAGSRWFLGDLVEEGAGLAFTPESGGILDTGPAWYAPQLLDAGGRILAWGWARDTSRTEAEVLGSAWAGSLSFPRRIDVREGQVVMEPAAELAALRAGALPWRPGAPVGVPAFEVVASGPVRLTLEGRDVVAAAGRPDSPARVLVDGGLVEAFAQGQAHTTWGRPGPDHAWVVHADPGTVALHRLALPGPDPC